MPRPKKPINYDEEIQRIDMQICKWKKTILELQEDRKALVEEKQKKELASLYQAIQSSGKSIAEVLSMINSMAQSPSAASKTDAMENLENAG